MLVPKSHVKSPGEKRLPNPPRELISLVQGREAPSAKAGREDLRKDHGHSQSLQPRQPVAEFFLPPTASTHAWC